MTRTTALGNAARARCSVASTYGIGRLSECDAYGAELLFPADRQVGDHGELFAAVGHVDLDLVVRTPRRFRRYDLHR